MARAFTTPTGRTIDFGAIESVSVWLQNLPPGQATKCRLGPVQALPLRPGLVKNPSLCVGGKTIAFPVELASGGWIECNGSNDCVAYGSRGEPLGQLTPRGDWPALNAGVTPIQFSCESSGAIRPRARVTFFTRGKAL